MLVQFQWQLYLTCTYLCIDCDMAASSSAVHFSNVGRWEAGWCHQHGSSHPKSERIGQSRPPCSSTQAPSFQQCCSTRFTSAEWNLLECSLGQLASQNCLLLGYFVRIRKTRTDESLYGSDKFCSVMGLQFSNTRNSSELTHVVTIHMAIFQNSDSCPTN